MSEQKKNRAVGHNLSTVVMIALALWTIANVAFASLSYFQVKDTVSQLAFARGRESFNKDQAFRLWGTMHGGVYVPISEETPPSPYLKHIPERDIVTPEGRKLTLLNPAYMMRQLNEYYAELFGAHGHITSLDPLRPLNKADEWEAAALRRFESGVQEVSEFVEEDGVPYLRLIRPMVTTEGCLKCHAHQGYKVGDIRGGVSVRVPVAAFMTYQASQVLLAKIGIPLLWGGGVVFILVVGLFSRRVRRERMRSQQRILRESTLNRAQARIVKAFDEDDSRVEDIAQVVHECALEVSGSKYCFVGSIDPVSKGLTGHAVQRMYEEGTCAMKAEGAVVFPRGPQGYAGLWGHGLNTRAGFFTNDPAMHPCAKGLPEGHVALESYLAVPAMHRGKLLGQVAVANAKKGYTQEDLQAVEALAGLFALGLHRRSMHRHLLEAKEAADSASKVKSDFLANMSHEIRTPMNGIIGMLQLLASTSLDKSQDEYVTLASQSSSRLVSLLSDILDLSQVEAGRLSIAREPFALGDAVLQVGQLFRPVAEQAGVDMQVVVDPSVPATVLGDSVRLQQVLTNLLGNALKFSPEGKVWMEARRLPASLPGKAVVLFSVADTGSGIPEDKLQELFTPFVQASRGLSRRHEGAGLGLVICKRLVGLMGGDISLESAEGVGTTVVFSLPFALAQRAVGLISAREVSSVQSGGVRVLLVEDDQVSRFSAMKQLEKLGCEVTTAEDGAKALDALRRGDYSLVFMDVQMPVMGGVEATRAIRSGQVGESARGIPIIAMTAYAMAGDRERLLQAGMTDYLAKPVLVEDLADVLTHHAG